MGYEVNLIWRGEPPDNLFCVAEKVQLGSEIEESSETLA